MNSTIGAQKTLAVTILSASLLMLPSCDDVEAHFETRDSAVAAAALGAGHFLPEFVPLSAKQIVDEHNLDNNRGRFTFTHDAAQAEWPLTAGFTKIDTAQSDARADEAVYMIIKREGRSKITYRCIVSDTRSTCTYL